MNPTSEAEVLIVGAGAIGSALAMSLARRGVRGVRVIDFDLEGTLSSSELNAGGVRGTWNQPINVEMSRQTIDYLATVADEVGYRPCGYLWLHSPEKIAGALSARERQQALGWPVEAWDLAELKRRVPLIDKTEGLAGATFGPRDGLVNPNLLKLHFRSKAREAGAVFEDRSWLVGCEHAQGRAQLTIKRFTRPLNEEEKRALLTHGVGALESLTETVRVSAKRVVNCAGAWAAPVARVLGYETPSHASRRQVSIFDCRDADLTQYGMIVDTSGVYFHPEAMNGLAGFAVPGESQGVNFESQGSDYFMEYIWPALFERSSAFEKLRFLTGWAGQYEVSPDESAIIGRVEQGEAGRAGNVYESHSYSGHGIMHSYSAGEALAELIVDGRPSCVDIAPLSGSRFVTGRLVHETQII